VRDMSEAFARDEQGSRDIKITSEKLRPTSGIQPVWARGAAIERRRAGMTETV
jgi:hypothetical protein